MSTSQRNPVWTPPPAEYLAPLDGAELARWELAPGDIFITSPAGKILRLKRAGDVLESEWRARFAGSKRLSWISLVNLDRVETLDRHFSAWKSAEDPSDRAEALRVFMQALRVGLSPAGGLSLLDWSVTCHRLFKPDAELVEEFHGSHVLLYRRALLVSSLAVLFGLACGYHDEVFLRDLYHAAWWLDAGLCDERFSHWVALACQAESRQPGAGLAFLRHCGAGAEERELFLSHPQRGFERAREKLAQFSFPEMLSSVLRHHERSDGSGFPEQLPLSALSDWETLMMLADHMVDYREEVLEQHLRHGWDECWRAFAATPVQSLPVRPVLSKLMAWFKGGAP